MMVIFALLTAVAASTSGRRGITPDPCVGVDCGFAGHCERLTDTAYECRCEEGRSAKRPGSFLDICYDPCPASGCGIAGYCVRLTGTTYKCRCEKGRSAKRPGSFLDICYDPCPSLGCGVASQCVVLTGTTYECLCEEGRSIKLPGATASDARCDDDPCPREGCGFMGQCVALTATTYECRCDESRSAKKPGASPSDICECVPLSGTTYECRCEDGLSIKKHGATRSHICHDPCPVAGCGFAGECVPLTGATYECRCEYGRSVKKPGATSRSDICYDFCDNSDNGGCGNDQCWNWGNGGASCVDMFCSPGVLPSQAKFSSSSSDLLQDVLAVGDSFGASIALLSDMDGDGVKDVAVGARDAVYILLLRRDGSIKKVAHKVSSPYDFGSAVPAIGDLDGDGVDAIVVGASGDRDGEVAGAVFVLFLRRDGTVKAEQKISSTRGGSVSGLTPRGKFGALLL